MNELTVDEYTTPYVVSIPSNASLDSGLELMQEHGIRHLAVIDEGELQGVVSERDLVTHAGKSWAKILKIEDVMSPDPLVVNKDEALSQVAYQLSSHKVGSAIVLDEDSQVYGIFTTTDALNALVDLHFSKNQT